MFEQEISTARKDLSRYFQEWKTFSSSFLIWLIEEYGIPLDEESKNHIHYIWVLARLLDDLVDEYKVPVDFIIWELHENSSIDEVRIFLNELSDAQKFEFIKMGKLVLHITWIHKQGTKKHCVVRQLEAQVLCKVYTSVLISKISQEELLQLQRYLKHLFITSYFHGDLSHFSRDNILSYADIPLYCIILVKNLANFILKNPKPISALTFSIKVAVLSYLHGKKYAVK